MATATSPAEDAEQILLMFAHFRSMGIDELDAQSLATAGIELAEVLALLNQGCPKKLIARILA